MIFARVFAAIVLFGMFLAFALVLSGCETTKARIAGVVNGQEVVTSAPVKVERPYLRDTLRESDVVCPEEPAGRADTQKQVNQSVQDKVRWGRNCRARSKAVWKVIQAEP